MVLECPYRHYIALVLLALYAFIAMPVQWWHHHPAGHHKAGKTGIGAAKSINLSPEDCQVCFHKYSAYHDDHTIPGQLVTHLFPSFEARSGVTHSEVFLFNLSNKSPPVASL